ncbi:MAG: helix-turn-helix transcriptional regulator [Oscillospiraceae bacterium]|nr:helix-turn-helix transcriptional regulator [Oscillospiraceae bacterium]
MLNENIKNFRKNKGLTQEEMAIRLNVVRQTVSKWEKGYSVPDAEMLQKIAELFDTDVSKLLGSPVAENTDVDAVAEQLARINEQLTIRNRRSRRIWKIIGIAAIVIVVINILLAVLGAILFDNMKFDSESTEIVEVYESEDFE